MTKKSNAPELALTVDSILFRKIKKFHEDFSLGLAKYSTNALRRCAWRIEMYLEDEGQAKYKDAEYLRIVQQIIEWTIQKKGGTDWTVEKAKTDLRGRTCGINQFAPKYKPAKKSTVSPKLSKAINQRILDIPRREFD